jgi:ferric hydroxamate transport system substrate-binding protein
MKPMRIALAAVAATLLLGACGTTETPAGSDPSGAAAGGPVTVTDARNKEIKLDKPAGRVVSLEWGETEMLVTLGVMPVGASDTKNYAIWDTAAKLDAGVQDLGTRGEPSTDAIAKLAPDLIISNEGGVSADVITQLEKIAPVLVTKTSDAKDNLTRMRNDFNLIAKAVGKTDKATEVLATFDKKIADGKAAIAAKGAPKPFVIADGYLQGSTISIRMFGQGSLVSQVGLALGLTNAWTGPVDEVWGLGGTDVEGLTTLKDADIHFFYNASEGDVFAQGLAGNAIWESLTFVKNKQLHKQPNGIWTFGGPLSNSQYIDALVKAYTA